MTETVELKPLLRRILAYVEEMPRLRPEDAHHNDRERQRELEDQRDPLIEDITEALTRSDPAVRDRVTDDGRLPRSDGRYPHTFYDVDDGHSRIKVAEYVGHDHVTFGIMRTESPGLWWEVNLSPADATQFALHILEGPLANLELDALRTSPPETASDDLVGWLDIREFITERAEVLRKQVPRQVFWALLDDMSAKLRGVRALDPLPTPPAKEPQ